MARFIGERQHKIPEALKEVAADPVRPKKKVWFRLPD